MRAGNREIMANWFQAQEKKNQQQQETMSLFFICLFLWIRVLIALYFSGRKQSKEKVTQTGRGGKSKALCFSGFWVKRLSGNIPIIRTILGKFKAICFPFSTFFLSTAPGLGWYPWLCEHRRFGSGPPGRKGRGKGKH